MSSYALAPPGCSIDAVAPDTVRIVGVDIFGITGDDVELGTITFATDLLEGVADININESTLLLSDASAGQELSVTPTNGQVTIAKPGSTAAPTASSTPAQTPTETPAALPGTNAGQNTCYQYPDGTVICE